MVTGSPGGSALIYVRTEGAWDEKSPRRLLLGKVLAEKPAPRRLVGHQAGRTVDLDRTEAAQGWIVLARPRMALAQPRGFRTGVEEDVVPAVDLSDDHEGAAAAVGKLLDGGIPIR